MARRLFGLACWLGALGVMAGCANGAAGSTITLSVPSLGPGGPLVTVRMGAPLRASASGLPASLLIGCHADPRRSVAVRIDAVVTAASARPLSVSLGLVPAEPPGRVVVQAPSADPCDYRGGARIGTRATVWQGHPHSYDSWVVFVNAIGRGSQASGQGLGDWVLSVRLSIGQEGWRPPLLRVTGSRAIICPDRAGVGQAYLVPAGRPWVRPPWAAPGGCERAGG